MSRKNEFLHSKDLKKVTKRCLRDLAIIKQCLSSLDLIWDVHSLGCTSLLNNLVIVTVESARIWKEKGVAKNLNQVLTILEENSSD